MPSAQSLWSDCAEAWRRYGGISICNTTVYPDMFNFRKLTVLWPAELSLYESS